MNNFNKILLRYKLSCNATYVITTTTMIGTTSYYFKQFRFKRPDNCILKITTDVMIFALSAVCGMGTSMGVLFAIQSIGKIGLTPTFATALIIYNCVRSDRPQKNDE